MELDEKHIICKGPFIVGENDTIEAGAASQCFTREPLSCFEEGNLKPLWVESDRWNKKMKQPCARFEQEVIERSECGHASEKSGLRFREVPRNEEEPIPRILANAKELFRREVHLRNQDQLRKHCENTRQSCGDIDQEISCRKLINRATVGAGKEKNQELLIHFEAYPREKYEAGLMIKFAQLCVEDVSEQKCQRGQKFSISEMLAFAFGPSLFRIYKESSVARAPLIRNDAKHDESGQIAPQTKEGLNCSKFGEKSPGAIRKRNASKNRWKNKNQCRLTYRQLLQSLRVLLEQQLKSEKLLNARLHAQNKLMRHAWSQVATKPWKGADSVASAKYSWMELSITHLEEHLQLLEGQKLMLVTQMKSAREKTLRE